MKKVLRNLALTAALIISLLSIAACGKTYVTIDKDSVIIIASNDVMEITSETTLLDYMEALKNKNELTYEATESETYGKYITSINDKTAGISQSWMIYTSDAENSNSEWRTIPYNEKEYASASSGISSLIIKEGETYILALMSY